MAAGGGELGGRGLPPGENEGIAEEVGTATAGDTEEAGDAGAGGVADAEAAGEGVDEREGVDGGDTPADCGSLPRPG